ncbi:hypothetical protein AUJ14_05130 [Candidatus Micrarchaeota archaeon CG1_02_55_22]|nr:MAG: hypothetical protein AUJ14_05130 [Candidatus Micrarchaeota archaeon CG1_02_55_22]
MKTVAITGAAGKLGRVVARFFSGKGWRVVAIVLPGHAVSARNALPKTKIVEADLVDPSAKGIARLAKAFKGVDAVVHLAGLVDYHAPRSKLFEANVETTGNALIAARKAGVKRFVYASSTTLYRKPKYLPIDENHPVEVVNEYGASKEAAEALVRNSGVPYVILRPCALYGPAFTAQYESLLKRIEKGRMRLIGDGGNHVAFLFEDDAAEAFFKAASGKAVNEDFIVAPNEKITQRQAFGIVAGALGVKPPSKKLPKRLAWLAALFEKNKAALLGKRPSVTLEEVDSICGDRHYDAGKAEKLLGWSAKTRFNDGVKKMVAAR